MPLVNPELDRKDSSPTSERGERCPDDSLTRDCLARPRGDGLMVVRMGVVVPQYDHLYLTKISLSGDPAEWWDHLVLTTQGGRESMGEGQRPSSGGPRPTRVGVLAIGTLDGWSREEKSLVMFLLFFRQVFPGEVAGAG